MKKTVSLFLVLIICLLLCACDADRNSAETTAPQTEPPTTAATEATEATQPCTTEPTEAPTEALTETVALQGRDYVLNTNTFKFHFPGCTSVSKIKEHNRMDFRGTREKLLEMGYSPCRICNP